jgi:hypothetical protein
MQKVAARESTHVATRRMADDIGVLTVISVTFQPVEHAHDMLQFLFVGKGDADFPFSRR